ncbi:hypothetical protein TGVAND_231050 [Toxoplasma gondii VAND]|uniref:Uncharacterized protein n=1 Tax=Toxoplasma gondii VAND TaxID=933077 RepID=A0A086QEN9_TOXGO|nr:hypothetical protein TGVAND_231050 [Toxoplasma gondii VAND]
MVSDKTPCFKKDSRGVYHLGGRTRQIRTFFSKGRQFSGAGAPNIGMTEAGHPWLSRSPGRTILTVLSVHPRGICYLHRECTRHERYNTLRPVVITLLRDRDIVLPLRQHVQVQHVHLSEKLRGYVLATFGQQTNVMRASWDRSTGRSQKQNPHSCAFRQKIRSTQCRGANQAASLYASSRSCF